MGSIGAEWKKFKNAAQRKEYSERDDKPNAENQFKPYESFSAPQEDKKPAHFNPDTNTAKRFVAQNQNKPKKFD